MYYHYKLVLFLVMLAIPFAVVVLGNQFNSGVRTFARVLLAVMLTWAWVIATRIIVNEVDVRLAETPERLQEIYDGDGAKNAFAAVFGWVPGLILVVVYWLVARALLLVRSRRRIRDAAA